MVQGAIDAESEILAKPVSMPMLAFSYDFVVESQTDRGDFSQDFFLETDLDQLFGVGALAHRGLKPKGC